VTQPDETQLTVAGTTTGTPGYMAPEVVMGDAPVDGRADLYAVGCVAYLLLTGTPVFDEVNPTNLMLKHLQTTPDPPSTRTELSIPADLERIVLQCLAKQPTGRPSSARQLSDQLAACAAPVWNADAAADWWEEHLPPTSSLRASARSGPAPSTAVRGA
jgi:serine/threonine-protein kinase